MRKARAQCEKPPKPVNKCRRVGFCIHGLFKWLLRSFRRHVLLIL